MLCLNTCVHYAMFNSESMSSAPQTFTIPCDADIPSLFFYNFERHDAVSLLSACAMGTRSFSLLSDYYPPNGLPLLPPDFSDHNSILKFCETDNF